MEGGRFGLILEGFGDLGLAEAADRGASFPAEEARPMARREGGEQGMGKEFGLSGG